MLYELFTGERPFKTPTELFEQSGVFAVKPSAHRPELPKGFDAWLQKLCTFEPDQRPTRGAGHSTSSKSRSSIPSAASSRRHGAAPSTPPPEPPLPQLDYSNLLPQTQLTPQVRGREAPREAGLVRRRRTRSSTRSATCRAR